VTPFVVGDAIRDIAASDGWQLRYPVGPDAAGLIAWRASMSDEDWIASAAVSDEEWVAYMKNVRGWMCSCRQQTATQAAAGS